MRSRCSLLVILVIPLFSLSGSALAIGPPVTFESTGNEQHYTVPGGVRLVAVLVQGAWGGGWGGGCCPPHYTSVNGQSGASWQSGRRATRLGDDPTVTNLTTANQTLGTDGSRHMGKLLGVTTNVASFGYTSLATSRHPISGSDGTRTRDPGVTVRLR